MEILVDTKKKGGSLLLHDLRKSISCRIRWLPFLNSLIHLSIAEGIKFVRQAYYDGGPSDYHLPNDLERAFIFSYLGNTRDSSRLISSFIDSARQTARISMSMEDIGTSRMDQLMATLTPKIYTVLDTCKIQGYSYRV
jgi:hypothetical protein